MLRVGFSEGIKAHVTTSARCLWIRQRRVRRPASLLLGAPRWFAREQPALLASRSSSRRHDQPISAPGPNLQGRGSALRGHSPKSSRGNSAGVTGKEAPLFGALTTLEGRSRGLLGAVGCCVGGARWKTA